MVTVHVPVLFPSPSCSVTFPLPTKVLFIGGGLGTLGLGGLGGGRADPTLTILHKPRRTRLRDKTANTFFCILGVASIGRVATVLLNGVRNFCKLLKHVLDKYELGSRIPDVIDRILSYTITKEFY